MGYACPVCSAPQVDAKHLADHLAFTALLGDEDHETWLEEHAPGWEQEDDAGLAERVLAEAEEIDLPEVDADWHSHAPSDVDFAESDHDPGVAFDDFDQIDATEHSPLDAQARAALEEAYELTRERRDRATDEADAQPAEDDAAETE